MAKTNVPRQPIFTHEGAKAWHINAEQQLRRSVMACMLWENEFYEDGESIAARVSQAVEQVAPEKVVEIAIEAREKMKLRHVPLLIVREMAKLPLHKSLVAKTLTRIIQRPDELAEFLAIYWKNGRQPLSSQVKKGLASAFRKFNEYSLAKYDRAGAVKLRDALFLSHAKPENEMQRILWKKLIEGQLAVPDTWEVALSTGQDKKTAWERLITENKLGALAFLRNLRNMKNAGVDEAIIFAGLTRMKVERVLPFRFLAAAKHAPQWEAQIEPVMLKCLKGKEKLPGKTALVLDGSGSMFGSKVSVRSELDRFEAAAALAILVREICEQCVILVFSINSFVVPARRGFALRDALYKMAEHSGTYTQRAVLHAAEEGYDRLIIITDEQSHQSITNPLVGTNAYVVNVASYKNGIGYGPWVHIDGWSEAVINYIMMHEAAD